MTRDRTGPPSMTIKCSDGASNNPMSPYATEYSARIGIGQKAQVNLHQFKKKSKTQIFHRCFLGEFEYNQQSHRIPKQLSTRSLLFDQNRPNRQ